MNQCDNCGAFVSKHHIKRVRIYLPAFKRMVVREWCVRCDNQRAE